MICKGMGGMPIPNSVILEDPMKQKSMLVLVLLLFLAGIGVLIYPTLSNYLNTRNGSYAIRDLESRLAQVRDEELEKQYRLAAAYNADLAAGNDPENYEEILDFGGGLMGYIRIPKIDVYLPIYHGTGEEVLSKGAGHMPGSAFPIGGTGSHAVLTGHTGLPSARLFTDLTELETGDIFSVHILDRVLCYRVDQILVVLPDRGEALAPVPGEDLCTLVTCTPYGVNSHRLLVRGRRLPENEVSGIREPDPVTIPKLDLPTELMVSAAAAAGILICLVILLLKKER